MKLSEIIILFPIGSAVVVQRDDKVPWTHGTIIEKGDQNYSDPSYKIHMTMMGNTNHIRLIPQGIRYPEPEKETHCRT